MRRPRKLLSRTMLEAIDEDIESGVPLTRAIRKQSLDVTYPVVKKLLAYKDDPQAQASLFPDWLDPDSNEVQVQPEGWVYSGFFPRGEWLCKNT